MKSSNELKPLWTPDPKNVLKTNLSLFGNKAAAKYGADKLPIILHSDPIVRYYNFRAGDILAINRADNTISYRIVR